MLLVSHQQAGHHASISQIHNILEFLEIINTSDANLSRYNLGGANLSNFNFGEISIPDTLVSPGNQQIIQDFLAQQSSYGGLVESDRLKSELRKFISASKGLKDGIDKIEEILSRLNIEISSNRIEKLKKLKNKIHQNEAQAQRILIQNINQTLLSSQHKQEIEQILAKYLDYKAEIENLKNNLKADGRYLDFIVGHLNDSVSKKLSDILSCKNAGTVRDTRPFEMQYYCDEIPVGKTDKGLNYSQYAKNYIRHNRIRIDRMAQMDRRDFWNGVLPANYYRINGLYRKLTKAQFERTYSAELAKWKLDKEYYSHELSYKDKATTRNYQIPINGKRKLNGSFSTYSEQSFQKGGLAYGSGCFRAPGLTIYETRQTFKYTIAKNFLGSISERAKVTFPSVSFQGMSTCALFKLDLRDPRNPDFKLIAMTPPRFSNVRLTPLKIRFSGGIFGFADKLLKVISLGTFDLDDFVSELINKKFLVSEQDLKSGAWMVKHMQAVIVAQFGEATLPSNLSSHISKAKRDVASQTGLEARSRSMIEELQKLIQKRIDDMKKEI